MLSRLADHDLRPAAASTSTSAAHALAPAAVPAVRLDGVVKRFGSVTALEETWLKVEPGEFLTLLGPSGCGKTTLLNLMAGFTEADGGEIFIGGELVTATPAHERRIGIVFQSYALFPHMNVETNVGYGLRMRGVPRGEAAERVRQALDLVKLTGLADRRPRQLSGGQQQRVALARALVIRPRVLLLDEPFSALDKNLRGAMQVELKEIQRKLGVTTVFVTHDQGEALSMSDRIVVMSQGRIRQIGTPDAVYRRPQDRFVAGFVGDVNTLPGRVLRRSGGRATVAVGGIEREVDSGTMGGLTAGDAVDLFVRPDGIRPCDPGTPGSLPARVRSLVYQGAHVDLHAELDLHAEVKAPAGTRILARVPAHAAPSSFAAGARIGLALPDADLVAFPPDRDADPAAAPSNPA